VTDKVVRSAVTVSLVEEARGGPFVFWGGLSDAAAQAADLGFDALEVFAPDAQSVNVPELLNLCERHGLRIAAFGTGAGMVKHGLSLTSADASQRREARRFVQQIIELGSHFNAPAIIGSMQGRWTTQVSRDQALGWLSEELTALGMIAAEHGMQLLFEPLNRYESNLLNTLAATREFLKTLSMPNVRILADLFHMNIEECNSAAALQECSDVIGHIHFADSNRRAVGMGQSDVASIAAAIVDSGYRGYLSAEILPLPNSTEAARKTIESFRTMFG
jgi:sugar phosphate isomerase/epimerase